MRKNGNHFIQSNFELQIHIIEFLISCINNLAYKIFFLILSAISIVTYDMKYATVWNE